MWESIQCIASQTVFICMQHTPHMHEHNIPSESPTSGYEKKQRTAL